MEGRTSATYTCARCGRTFWKGWSEEEADAELEENFPGANKDDCVLACDSCYKAIMEILSN